MHTDTIRKKFISFFQEKGHTLLPSAPLVNRNETDLLFTIAGMNPFKNIFLGYQKPAHKRVVTTQFCLRVAGKHNDLEDVGIDTYHHTLFEMLGNWSFADYFKKEAIQWAWELLTQHYNIDPTRLYATVFKGDSIHDLDPDHESFELWKNYLPPSRILYSAKEDNFWEMGSTGPCGPCTEIHIDLRPKKEREATSGAELVNTNHPRVIELWNIVFIEHEKNTQQILTPLPQQHVDTGMGLERLAMALQNKYSTYETDIFMPLIEAMEKLTKVRYGTSARMDIALRVIADHIRAITLAIAEGAHPSNQKEGYVIRRILRRALRYGYTHLNIREPFLYNLVPQTLENVSKVFPSLITQKEHIQQSVYQEELSFMSTLAHGIDKFNQYIYQLPSQTTTLDGNIVFQLYDTYGFPPDLTNLMAREKGFTIDQKSFDQAMRIQKQKSKKTAMLHEGPWQVIHKNTSSTFIGYDQLEATTTLIKYRKVEEKNKICYQLVFAKTPFYAEAGGQIGDKGYIIISGERIPVLDTKKINEDIIHCTSILPKDLHAPVQCEVDAYRRSNTTKNHTATHLMFKAMTELLGTHVTQQGSLVHDKGLRFDFSHHQKVSPDFLRKIEELVNNQIRANIPLEEYRSIPIEEAKEMGATAQFEDKYGENVRVVKYGNYCADLCGGTHVQSTGAIGLFKIQAEKSVCTGVRRVEAITGVEAEKWVQYQQDTLEGVCKKLKNIQDPIKAVSLLLTKYKKTSEQLEKVMHKILLQEKKKVQAQLKQLDDIYVGTVCIEVETSDTLKKIAFSLAKTYPSLLLILATKLQNKVHLLAYVSPTLSKQYRADAIMKELSSYIKGKGGGSAHLAVANGHYLEGMHIALDKAYLLLSKSITEKSKLL